MDGNFVYLEDMILGVSQSIVGGGGGTGSGAPGTSGTSGTSGIGIPAGGTAGYILAKASSSDYDTEWVENTGGGGSGEPGTSGTSGQDGTSGTSGISGAGMAILGNNYFLESNDFDLLDPTKLDSYAVDQDNDNIEISLPEDFGYFEFLGNTYSSVFVNTNSYVTFGGTSSEYQIMAPVKVDVPAIFIGAGDNSLQYLSIGYDYDTNPGDLGDQIFRIRFEGSANQSGSMIGLAGIAWEMLFDKNNKNFIKIVVASLGNNNGAYRNERNPGGVYGISDGAKWIDIFPSLPTFEEQSGEVLNTAVVVPFNEASAEGVKFVGPGVYSLMYGTVSYVKIDPLNQFGLSVGYDNLTSSPAASVISSNRYDLRLTTGENGSAVRIRPRGEAWIQPFPKNNNQFGDGHSVFVYAGNAAKEADGSGTYSGGNIYLLGGAGAGGDRGSVYIGLTSSPWVFDPNTRDLTLPLGGDIKDSFGSSVLGGGGGAGLTELTYSQIASLMAADGLNPGSFYKITDFKTCYDQPDFDSFGNPTWSAASYKEASVSPLIVFAISGATFSPDAWQPEFPKDKLKYDFSWNLTEVTGGTAYGRITERIDEFNNRTDYDHRTVLFKRYDWYSYDVSDILAGTISFVDGVVTGEGTTFTGLTAGQIIAIPDLTPQFYKIGSIDSDTQMSLTGSFWEVTGGPSKHYAIDYTMESASYKMNNVDDEPYQMTTFAAVDGASENYIGNNPNQFFILSNNVFKDGPYENNTFGNNCFNNTFDDDCTGNKIGNWFTNNITDDDFDGNFIADGFSDNIITSNFQRNHVGENFSYNKITVGSFYRNRIGEGFTDNNIAGANFQNNVIGNAFNNNRIVTDYDGFLKNVMGVGFNGNEIWREFNGNTIGNGAYGNVFRSRVLNNRIGHYFGSNNIGIESSYSVFESNDIGNDFYNCDTYSEFKENHISNRFQDCTIYSQFKQNQIGNEFTFNTIGNTASMGDLAFSKNRISERVKSNLFSGDTGGNDIGAEFYSNVVGQYCYSNIIGPGAFFNNIGTGFENNIIGQFFTDNDILDNFANNRIMGAFVGNNISNNFAYNTIATDFGFGGSQARGNTIGNNFENNTVGEYFYDNRVADLFSYNTLGDYFQLNDIKINYVHNINFRENYNTIQSYTTNIGLSPSIPGTDNVYLNLGATGGSGHGAEFDVTVSGSVVTSVVIQAVGYQYATGNTMSIPYDLFGGTPGFDIVITVGTVSGTPSAYGAYNTDIFKNSAGTSRLSYYDADDVLTIKGITE
jgi:hypothetical protein